MRFTRVAGSLVAAVAIAFATGPAQATDFTTNQFDGGRDGWNSSETILTPDNAPNIQLVVNTNLGGAGAVVDAQPLYLSSESTPIGVTNVIYVATEDNQIRAYSPRRNQLAWSRWFGAPVTNQMTGGCTGETDPTLGITGTPVIDTTTDTLYFVTDNNVNGNAVFTLHAVSAGDGSDKIIGGGQQIPIDWPNLRKQRPALALANGNIYIAFGGAGCDYSAFQSFGQIFAYSASTLQPVASFTPANRNNPNCGGVFLDSIWMSGNGPAVDAYGNIWYTTGNGCLDPGGGSLGMALIRMSPTLGWPNGGNYDMQIVNRAPTENGQDLDTGSGGVSIGTSGLVVYGGKDGQTWIVDSFAGSYLGGYCFNPCLHPNDYGWEKTNGGLWGSSAIFTDPYGRTYIATGGQGNPGPPGSNGMAVYNFIGAARNGNAEVMVGSANDTLPNGGATPIVSSNGQTPNTYMLWFLKRVQTNGQVWLYGYNAENMQRRTVQVGGFWDRNRGRYAILTPAVADGYVIVASDNTLRVWTVPGNFAGVKPASRRHK